MGDAINFGPAWLRKVAFDSNTNSSNNSNHQNNTSGSHSNSSGQSMNNSSSSSSSGGSANVNNTSNTITTLVNNSGGGGGVGLHHQQHHSNHQHSQHHHGLSHSGSGSAIGGGAAAGGGGSGGGGMSNSTLSSSGAGSAAANNGAPTTRYALAEFRYGREEMLALFDSKTLKGPEILVNYKHLYVEKVQPPLALTPCPEEELATEPDARRIWQSRSISMGIPSRGGGRGVSVDRGRGRGRGAYTSYTRSTSFYDDESRGAGRGERPWLERNGGSAGGSGALGGGGGIGDIEWNSSASSPRKDYGSRIRSSAGGTTESWRRSRTDDDNTSNGIGGGGDWRSGGSGSLASGRDKWSRSTSWRDEDSSSHGLLERSLNSSSERMISVPAYKSRLSGAGHGGNELLNSSASGGHSSGPDKRRAHYDADELPEWATENPCDFGGSFDATGAFHDSDNDTDGANTAGGGGGGRLDASDNGSSSVKPASQKSKDSERSKPPAERRLGESGMLVGSGAVRDDAATCSTSASSSLSSASGAKSTGAEYGIDKDRTIDDEETMNNSANKELEGLQSDNNGSQTAFTTSSTVNSKTGGSMERESRDKDSSRKRDSQDERPGGVMATSEVSSSVKRRSASCESIESAVSETVALSSPAWGKSNELPSGANDGGTTVTERGNGDNVPQATGKSQPASLPPSTENEPKKSPSSTSVDRMQEVADDMVAQLIMDDEFLVTDGDPSVSGLGGSSVASTARHAGLEKSPVFGMSSVSGQVSAAAAAMGMPGSVGATGGLPLNMVLPKSPMPMQPMLNHNVHRVNALLMSDVSSRLHGGGGSGAGGAVAPGISQLHHLMASPAPGTDVWYYRDPQGKVQGPFPASEMTEWYRAGYFDDSLSVRRACDEVYTTLGTLVALCGGSIPFLNSMTIPPIKTSGGTNGTSGIKQSSQQQQTSQQQQQLQPGPGTQIQPKAAGGNVSGVVQPSPVNQQQPSIGGPQSGQPQSSALHTSGQGGASSATVGGMPAPPTEQELQQMKRLHVIRQHSLLIQKLNNSEGWHLLSPEQQNAIITQQMNQLVSADGLLMSPSLPGHQQQPSVGPSPGSSIFSGGPSIPQQAGQDALVNLKLRDIPPHPQQQPQSSQLPLLEQLQKSGNHQHNNFLKLHMPEFVQPQQVAGARPMMNILNADSAAAVTGGHDPLGQLMHGINFNQQPPVQNLGPLGPPNLMMNRGGLAMQPQQPTPQSQQSHPAGKPTVDNDPIQSLFMQLSLNKNQQHPQLTPHQQQSSKAAAELITPWLHTTAGQPQSQPPTTGATSGGGGGMPGVMPCSSASVPGAAGPAWGDLPPPPTSASFASLMQQQQQQQSHLPVAGHPLLMNSGGPSNEPQAPSVASLFKHHQQVEKQQQLEKEQLLQHQQHFAQLQQHQQQQLQSESDVLAQQKQQLQQQPHPPQHLQDQHQLLHQQQLQHLQQQQQQLQQLQQQQQQQQLPHPEEERFNQKHQTKEEQKKELMGGQQPPPPHAGSIVRKQNNKQLNHVDVDEKATSDSSLSGQQQPGQSKAKKPSKSNNNTHGGGSSNSNGHNNLVNENETEFICLKKEMEEKKRLKELKKLQQEEQKRKLVEEKKRQEEQDAQKKAKLLESQRREAIKIQEQQQQQQQPSHQQVARAASKPAPWSAAVAEVATSGLSLAEIQKAERERRALLARQEQTMREQQEQQQLLVLQAQLDSKLKWDAHLVPANVKPLAEIQAEEAAAAERAREKNLNVSGLTVAAITAQPAKVGKKDEALTLGTAVWQGQSGSSLLYWNSGKPWGGEGSNETTSSFATGNAMSNNISSGGFWEEPTQPTPVTAVAVGKGGNHARKTQTHGSTTTVAATGKQQQQQQQQQQQFLSKSKTMGSISTTSTSTVNAARQQQQKQQQPGGLVKVGSSAAGGVGGGAKTGKTSNAWGNAADRKEDRKNQNEQSNEFTSWCSRALSSLNSNVDIPTFVGFLQDIESPYEVKEYIRVYLGETKECSEFSKQFLERRSKYKNQQRQKNAHIDDMCKPAPAINPSSNDFQEIKGKGKKIKKNKMTKLDNRILGFSVTAAPDRLNVGDRDYGDNA